MLFFPPSSSIIYLPLTLSIHPPGVRGPDRESKWSDEALNFSRDKALHRDIEVDIEGFDRAGNFVGSLFLKKKVCSAIYHTYTLSFNNSPLRTLLS